MYTHSVAVDVFPFTLDEFAQAFHDKVMCNLNLNVFEGLPTELTQSFMIMNIFV